MNSETIVCHVCGSAAHLLGAYHPYLNVEARVFECKACGCRISPHDQQTHQILHSESSSYNQHYKVAETCRAAFDASDRKTLRSILSRARKFRYLIESVERHVPASGRLLEIGCSTGILGSWFILNGYDYLGTDIAEPAVAKARSCFGEKYFATTAEQDVSELEKFDAIFHAGTIGCVDSPFQLTRQLLKLLKPGGVLLFNAPNRDACIQNQQLWVEGTHPPDLVSLFTPGIWETEFHAEAEIQVDVEYHSGWQGLKRKLQSHRRWQWVPKTNLFSGTREETPVVCRPKDSLMVIVRRVLRSAVGTISNHLLGKQVPTDFGILVRMTPSKESRKAA